MKKYFILLAGTFLFSQMDAQVPNEDNVLFVNQNVSGGNGDGSSWGNAIAHLSDALKWARENQQSPTWSADEPLQIWVAEGTYKPLYDAADTEYTTNGDRDNSFVLIKNVQIYGGFSGTETSLEERDWEANATILSGNIGDEADIYDNVYHIVISAGDVEEALLDGFTLTDGRGDGSIFGGPVVNEIEINNGGGAINTRSSAPLFRNLKVDNNQGYWGGQIFNYQSSPTFENMEITNGWAFWGGGVYNRDANPVFNNVYIAENYGDLAGGGMYGVEYGHIDLNNVTFYKNTTGTGNGGQGGGFYSYVQVGLEMNNVSFIENFADSAGGAIGYVADGLDNDVLFQNCLFVGNKTGGHGGAILFYDSQKEINFKIESSTFYGNESATGGALGVWYDQEEGGIPIEFNNSIVWDNTSSIGGSPNPTFVINNSLLQDAECPAGLDCNNVIFNEDPIFTDAENGDFSLQQNSPAVNAGNNDLFTGLDENTLDLAGNARVYGFGNGGMIDLGAFEYQGGMNVSDLNSASKLSFYPNPVKRGNELTILSNEDGNSKLSLISLTGQIVYSSDFSGNTIQLSLPQNIQAGIYILKLDSGKVSKAVKLIVQ